MDRVSYCTRILYARSIIYYLLILLQDILHYSLCQFHNKMSVIMYIYSQRCSSHIIFVINMFHVVDSPWRCTSTMCGRWLPLGTHAGNCPSGLCSYKFCLHTFYVFIVIVIRVWNFRFGNKIRVFIMLCRKHRFEMFEYLGGVLGQVGIWFEKRERLDMSCILWCILKHFQNKYCNKCKTLVLHLLPWGPFALLQQFLSKFVELIFTRRIKK